MKEKVSIIVPIYKVEKYLDRCIKSIVDQTYKNLEIILVDDGSPDKCPKICDDWSKKDKRIKVIHKENGGLSDARNEGIRKATGSYIGFVDSDDYIEETFVEILYNSLKKGKTNISQCGINYINDDANIICIKGYDADVIKTGLQMINDYYGNHYIENVVVWNKLYDTNLFHKNHFPIGKIHEDEFTTYKLLYKEKNISIVHDNLYNYNQTAGGIMHSKNYIRHLDLLDALKEKICFFETNNAPNKIIEFAVRHYLYSIREEYYNLKKHYFNRRDLLLELRKEYKNVLKKYGRYKQIQDIIFIITPYFFGIIRNIKRVIKK